MPDDEFRVSVEGTGWYADLTVDLSGGTAWRPTRYAVTPLGARPGDGHLITVEADVRYAMARNAPDQVPTDWHVKMYRCQHASDADVLRAHLERQTTALQEVDNQAGPYRPANRPPWAVVTAQVVPAAAPATRPRTALGQPRPEAAGALARTWTAAGLPDPGRLVLVVSPTVENADWESPRSPGAPATEYLGSFRHLARGLDILHNSGWAHCDIKPEHVRRFRCQGEVGFALIDTDSAVRLDPPPLARELRTTAPYVYGPLCGADGSGRVDPGLLRAQDRVGFAVVVLLALIGRKTAETILFRTRSGERRMVDGRDTVRDALLRQWGGRWPDLAETLAEPFGRDGNGYRPVEAPDDWAGPWLDRLEAVRAVEHEARPQPFRTPRVEPAGPYREELRLIRHGGGGGAASPLLRADRAVQVAEQMAVRVAMRAAVTRFLLVVGVFMGVALMIVIGAGWGK